MQTRHDVIQKPVHDGVLVKSRGKSKSVVRHDPVCNDRYGDKDIGKYHIHGLLFDVFPEIPVIMGDVLVEKSANENKDGCTHPFASVKKRRE